MGTRLCSSEKNQQDYVFKDKGDLWIAVVRTVTEVNVPAVKNTNLQFGGQLRCLCASEPFWSLLNWETGQ